MLKEEHEDNRGPTRGYGMSEDNRTTWLLSIPAWTEHNSAMLMLMFIGQTLKKTLPTNMDMWALSQTRMKKTSEPPAAI